MSNTRRGFLSLVAAGSVAMLPASSLLSQVRPSQQGRPGGSSDPDLKPDEPKNEALPEKTPTKAILEANEKDIKKNIERLFQLVSDLKAEVEKTDSSQVLSLALLKKADEIEKLARDIKTRAKG